MAAVVVVLEVVFVEEALEAAFEVVVGELLVVGEEDAVFEGVACHGDAVFEGFGLGVVAGEACFVGLAEGAFEVHVLDDACDLGADAGPVGDGVLAVEEAADGGLGDALHHVWGDELCGPVDPVAEVDGGACVAEGADAGDEVGVGGAPLGEAALHAGHLNVEGVEVAEGGGGRRGFAPPENGEQRTENGTPHSGRRRGGIGLLFRRGVLKYRCFRSFDERMVQ